MSVKVILLTAAIFGGATIAAAAVPDKLNITPSEHAACDGDATSLCADSYPDETKLLACMKAKRRQLSPACSAAFEAGLEKRHLTR